MMTKLRTSLPFVVLWAALAAGSAVAEDARDYSAAERLLFMTRQFDGVKPPTTLKYAFRKSGSLEPGFDDKVELRLAAQSDGSCCAAHGEFLGGDRRITLPDLPAVEGNPVTMYFLERDVREMQRLTKGSQTHFRKQERMAIYSGATVRDVQVPYRGQRVAAQEVSFSPFLDDPNRPKFERFARKSYRFVLASAVPGGLYAAETRIAGADEQAPPLIVEELWLDGAEPLSTSLTPAADKRP